MSIWGKRWEIAPRLSSVDIRKYRNIHPILAQLLHNRNVEPDQAGSFLRDGDYTRFNPFVMKGIDTAVERITRAVKAGESIAVYGDFDADGVTATALMVHVLRRIRADVRPYIPDRVDEGYGLNTPALERLAEEGCTLVITVDCGIRSVIEVEQGIAAGLDMIITDHHSVGPDLPLAHAVINPQQADCGGEKALSGVGVAFMLARALLLQAAKRNGNNTHQLYKQVLDEVIDLVAIGTIADIMPLNEPVNRALVIAGLQAMNAPDYKRVGLKKLIEIADLPAGAINAGHIGFGVGPRINAAGRLASAMLAVDLLLAQDEGEAVRLAQELDQLNRQRQDETIDAQKRIGEQIEQEGLHLGTLIFAQDDHVKPGIVGLVAGRLAERYYRPSVILERGEVESRASCRSIPEFHITLALDQCADLLVRHGGHALAAGFTVDNRNIPLLRRKLEQQAEAQLSHLELQPLLLVDMVLESSEITLKLVETLRLLDPVGHKNPEPLFLMHGLKVREKRLVGQDGAHLKLKFAAGDLLLDAIAFRMGPFADDVGESVDVAFHLEINVWRGRESVQLRVVDLQQAQIVASI